MGGRIKGRKVKGTTEKTEEHKELKNEQTEVRVQGTNIPKRLRKRSVGLYYSSEDMCRNDVVHKGNC